MPRLKPKRPEPMPVEVAKAETQSEEQLNTDEISALLDKSKPEADAEATDALPTAGAATGDPDPKMTVNELEALRAKIVACWNVPLGASNAEEVRTVVQFHMNRDGTVAGTPTILERPSGRYAQIAPESIVRAIMQCAPYQLPPEKYDQWQEVRLNFNPIELF
jgi:colicin import membrane protein